MSEERNGYYLRSVQDLGKKLKLFMKIKLKKFGIS